MAMVLQRLRSLVSRASAGAAREEMAWGELGWPGNGSMAHGGSALDIYREKGEGERNPGRERLAAAISGAGRFPRSEWGEEVG
jgi:hypothetical protein